MFPTIDNLREPSNDISEDWMRASADAQQLSIFYKKLANDQFDAYEKTMDRIMSIHNGQNFRYKNPENGRYISRLDSPANDDKRIIHDYNPEIPQSMYKDLPKYLMKDDKPIEKNDSIFNADDKRSELDILKSIDNSTTNILDTLHRISYSLDDFQGEDSLKAREKDLESGHGLNQESLDAILAGLSGAKRDGKDNNSKEGILGGILGLGKDAGWALGLGIGGLASTLTSKLIGTESPIAPGGGDTGSRSNPNLRADSPDRHGGETPQRNTFAKPSTKENAITGEPHHMNTTKRKQELELMSYDSFRKLGYTDQAAKMMVAEIGRENAFNEDTSGKRGDIFGYHIDPGNHQLNLGLISWQKDRREALEKFLSSKGLMKNGKMIRNQASLDAMAEFMDNEMKTGTGGLGKRGKQAYRDVRDPSKGPNELEASIGRHVIKWDPNRDHNGMSRMNDFLDSITKLVDERIKESKNQEEHNNIKSSEDKKIVRSLRNVKAGQQVRFNNGEVAGQGSVTVNLPPAQPPVHHTQIIHTNKEEKRRPKPAKSDWWDEWKAYFGLYYGT
jgi:hypothetical protein